MLQVDNDPIILGPGSPLSAAPLTGVAAPTSETKASYTIQTALKLEAKALGTLGNAVKVKAEANSSDNLAISVTGNDLTILLANATGSKNTMTLIAAAIAASTPANTLVNAIVITGATQMTAFTVQSLTGGLNGTAGYDLQVVKDTNNTEWKLIYSNAPYYYWAPTGFPADNVEYYDMIDRGKLVRKIRLTGTTGGTVNHFVDLNRGLGLIVNTKSAGLISDLYSASGSTDTWTKLGAYVNGSLFSSWRYAKGNIQMLFAGANYYNRPFILDFYFSYPS